MSRSDLLARWQRWLGTRSGRLLLRGLLVVLALAVAGYAARNALLGPEVDVYAVARGPIIQTVVSSGRVMSPQRVSVASVITAGVLRIPVEEGQRVRAGDVLIVLDDKDVRAALAQAHATQAAAEARLVQLRDVALPASRETLRQAQANLALARQQWQRAQDLQTKGFVSASALDDARRNLDVAQSQLDAAQLQVDTNSVTGSDYKMALAALEQGRANVAVAQARLDQTVIRANVDGTLIGRNIEPGHVVQPGRELMVLAPDGETQIVADIDEKNLAQLALGQQALVSADAYPRERFAATLFYINPGIDAQRGSIEIKLRVPSPPPYLRQDMTVSIDLEVARRAETVIVASDAIHDLASDHPWALAVDNHRAARRDLKLGLKGDGHVELLAGAVPGERLISAAASVRAGQRVRPVMADRGP